MKSNWQIYLKRAFRLAELLVAGALLAVLVELLLVHLDRASTSPDIVLIKQTRQTVSPVPVPATLPAKAMPMEVAAKPILRAPLTPVVPAPMVREGSREPMATSGNNTTINFVSLLQFRHVRARFTRTAPEPDPAQTLGTFPSNQPSSFTAFGASVFRLPGTNQTIAQTNSASGATNNVASTNKLGDSLPSLAATNEPRPARVNPPTRSSAAPTAGTIRLAIP